MYYHTMTWLLMQEIQRRCVRSTTSKKKTNGDTKSCGIKYASFISINPFKVLLDPTLTKNKDKSDWKAMKEELTKAGKLKVWT